MHSWHGWRLTSLAVLGFAYLVTNGAIASVMTPLPIVVCAATSPLPLEVSVTVREVAVQVGFDATSLAASGLSPSDAQSLLVRIADVPDLYNGLATARAAVDAAAIALLTAKQSAGDGNTAVANSLPALALALESASAATAAVRIELRTVALQGLPAPTILALDSLDATRHRKVPTEFMVVSRSTETWSALEEAIRREARCQRTGEALEAEYSALLQSVRAEPAVIAAASGIAEHRTAIEAILSGG